MAHIEILAQNKWTQKPVSQWKQIALINNVKFTDAKYNNPYAGSAFLLDTGKEIVAVTAKHVLLLAKSKPMTSVHFKGTLKEWAFHPKGDSTKPIIAKELVNTDINEKLNPAKLMNKDCIVFSLKDVPKHIQALKLRNTPIQPNETVYVIGCPYVDKSCVQNVYKGKFVRTQGVNLLVRLENAQLNLGGMSGGAVIDKNGKVVGVVSRMLRDSKTKEVLLAPISTNYLKKVLKQYKKM
ncbi:hypothetical protein BKI52_35760 [marine bacterium AO1-C]|nr:hypothetical protein BKI52_35760 [marine bacterium AO1-C]